MRKALTYFGLIIAGLVVILAFVTATTYTQLAVAIILFPIFVYFAFKVLPRKTWAVYPSAQVATIQPASGKLSEEEAGNIIDIDRRAFLKVIGAAGLGLFLYSIFIKRAEVPFFGAASPKIEPAERQPTDGYRITEIDDSIIAYYGFTHKDGAWFIMREDTETGSFRYAKGDFNFTSGWANREGLKYDYFSNVF